MNVIEAFYNPDTYFDKYTGLATPILNAEKGRLAKKDQFNIDNFMGAPIHVFHVLTESPQANVYVAQFVISRLLVKEFKIKSVGQNKIAEELKYFEKKFEYYNKLQSFLLEQDIHLTTLASFFSSNHKKYLIENFEPGFTFRQLESLYNKKQLNERQYLQAIRKYNEMELKISSVVKSKAFIHCCGSSNKNVDLKMNIDNAVYFDGHWKLLNPLFEIESK